MDGISDGAMKPGVKACLESLAFNHGHILVVARQDELMDMRGMKCGSS